MEFGSTIWGSVNRIQGLHVQGKCPSHWAIFLTWAQFSAANSAAPFWEGLLKFLSAVVLLQQRLSFTQLMPTVGWGQLAGRPCPLSLLHWHWLLMDRKERNTVQGTHEWQVTQPPHLLLQLALGQLCIVAWTLHTVTIAWNSSPIDPFHPPLKCPHGDRDTTPEICESHKIAPKFWHFSETERLGPAAWVFGL